MILKVSAADRVKQFPNEHFNVSSGKLFCLACREELSTKKSILELHIKAAKHVKGKEALISKQTSELSIVEALKRYDKSAHPVGETLPDSTRVKLVSEFLKAGIPLSKIDNLRVLFSSKQNTSLQDYISLSIMLQYNNKD